jgi:hypothetical protein
LKAVVTYMIPSTTIGVVSIVSTISVWKIQAGLSFPTLSALICRFG